MTDTTTGGFFDFVGNPNGYDAATAIANEVDSLGRLLDDCIKAAYGDFAERIAYADSLAQKASAWEKVTPEIAAMIDPNNRIDANRVALGEEIGKSLRESESFWRQHANRASCKIIFRKTA